MTSANFPDFATAFAFSVSSRAFTIMRIASPLFRPLRASPRC